jgi:hypothetical protein
MGSTLAERYNFADFTEESYRRIVRAAAASYEFEPFGTSTGRPHALWRHDVDFSPHRGLKLARIEADANVRATYFLALRSPFYNLLEPSVLARAREIAALGHWFGLHFELAASDQTDSSAGLAEALSFERRLLSELLDRPIESVSFHNPGTERKAPFDDELAGMINVYGRGIAESYLYVSDSNGFWQDRRLPDVIASGASDRLHVLTHPEWWQEVPMSPRERLARCIRGRAEHAQATYEDPVRAWGRELPG